MKKVRPLFDSTTHYWVDIQGRFDANWLQSFESAAEIIVDEAKLKDDITVISLHTDQSGIVGLVRRLHGRGIAILQLQVVLDQG